MNQADTLDASIHLAIIRYQDIPGIEIMQHLGQQLLVLALFEWLAREAYRMVQGEPTNWVHPFVRVGVGFLVLGFLPQVGQWILSLVQTVNNAMFEESKLALFGRSIAAALHSTQCDDIAWYDSFRLLFSPRGWVAIGSSILYLGMFLSKVLIIDVLFPVCFALVLFLGVLSIPISLFPGMNGIGGWIRNLIEVSLWPLIFQILIALVAASYPNIIAAMADGHVSIDCTPTLATDPDGGNSAPFETGILAMVEYAAVCLAYIILIWFTPLISAMVVRSAPVSLLGGIVAAKAASLAGAAMAPLGGGLASTGMKAGSQAIQLGGSAMQWGAQKIGQARSARAARLDQRDTRNRQQNSTAAEKGR